MSLSEKYYLQGKSYIQKERYDKAQESFKKLIEINPIFVDAYNELGNVYYEQQNFQEAELWYKKAIKINPKNPDFYNNLGNVYSDDKQFKKAVVQYEKAIKLKPNDADIHNNLANAYFNSGQFMKAINQFKVAIKLNPHDPDYRQNLNCIYTSILKKQQGQRFDENWVFDQNSHSCHKFLGRYFINKGCENKAVEQYQRMVELQPDLEPNYYELIQTYEHLNMHDKIIALCDRIPQEFRQKFKNYKIEAKYRKIFQDFNKKIKQFPEDAELYYKFGKQIMLQGHKDQANKYFRSAERLYESQGMVQQISRFYGKGDEISQQNLNNKQSQITKTESEIIFVDHQKIKQYMMCQLNLFYLQFDILPVDPIILSKILQKISFVYSQSKKQQAIKLFQLMGLNQRYFKKISYFSQSFRLISQVHRKLDQSYPNFHRQIQKYLEPVYAIIWKYHFVQVFQNQLTAQNVNEDVEQDQTPRLNIQFDVETEHQKIKQEINIQIRYAFEWLEELSRQQKQRQYRPIGRQKAPINITAVQPKQYYGNERHSPPPSSLQHYNSQQPKLLLINQNLIQVRERDLYSMKGRQVGRQVGIKARRVHNAPKKQQTQMKLKKKLKSKQTKFSYHQIQQIYSKMIQSQYKKDKKQFQEELFSLKNKLQEYQNCFDKNQMLTNRLNELQKQDKKKISNYGKKLYSFLVSIIEAYRMLDTNMLQKGEGLNEATGMVSKLLNYAQMLPIIGEVTSITKQITGLYWQKQDEIRSKTIVTNLGYFWNQKLMSDAVSQIVSLLISQEKYCNQIQEFQQKESGDIFQIFQGKKEAVVKIFTSVQKKEQENQQRLAIIDSSYILLGLAEIKEEEIQQFKKKNPQTENILIIQVHKLMQFRKNQKEKQGQKDKNSNPQISNYSKPLNQSWKPPKNLKYSIVFIVLMFLSILLTYWPSLLDFQWTKFYQNTNNRLYDSFEESPQHKIALNMLQKNQYILVQGSVQDGVLNFVEHFTNSQQEKQKNVIVQEFYTNENGMIQFTKDVIQDNRGEGQTSEKLESKTVWVLKSLTGSKIPKQTILKIISQNPLDKVIIVLPLDQNNQKISKVIKAPKFKEIDYSSIDDNYIKQSIQRNHKFDQQKSQILVQFYGNARNTYQAFSKCQDCTHQKLLGQEYVELKQFSQKDKRVLKILCKKGQVKSQSISQDLLEFGLVGQNGQIYWKNENYMLNYMLHKNKVCDKNGVLYQKQFNQASQQTQIKMFKMKIKKSGQQERYQIYSQDL